MARPRKFDESDVVARARTQFWRHGYEGTSMSGLCAATGVASQSLYGAFGSKHGLFVSTLQDYCTSQVDGLAASEDAATSPWAWLMAAVTFDDGGRLALGEDGCYLSGSTVALARLDADVQSASQETYDRILSLFATALRRGQALGELRGDVEIDEVALALLAAMQGIEFIRKSGLTAQQFATAKEGIVAALTRAYARTDASAS